MITTTPSPRLAPSPSGTGERARAHRPGPAPRAGVADALAALAGIGFGATLGSVVATESWGELASRGGLLLAIGRLAGFTGAYLMLVMVVLVARLPWLEGAVGQDRLVRLHRRIAPCALWLIAVHVVTITLGYAQLTRTGPLHELWTFVTTYPDMLAAMVGFGLLVMAGVTSVRMARRRMRYESWWIVHLYTYLGLALAFAHQIVTGISFLGHPLAKAIWVVAWASTAGVVLVFRFFQPIWRSVYHAVRIVSVREEVPGVCSVICSGRHLDRLAVSGGQFFQWRFLVPGLWWQAHPYSLSALPKPPYMRVTVKGIGDQSRAVARLRPGTRVAIEGPYGAFTRHARATDKVLLVGAGVGITPVRALLEDLPRGVDVSVVVRASTPEEVVHGDEVAALVAERGGRLHHLVGPRRDVHLDARSLRRIVPDLASRDVYVCGPGSFGDAVERAVTRLGVPEARVHREDFSF
ncbi:MAG: ferredoxin reductase family protein [Actinomycetota bacterium]|nr:ferredoxin reductase family protein [Actinomycetota bacterium]